MLSTLLTAAVLKAPKTLVIDLGDSNIKTIEIVKNPYGSNYQNKAPAVFTKFYKDNMPAPGDTVEVHYKFTSDVDIPGLTVAVIDNSEKAKPVVDVTVQFLYDDKIDSKLTLQKAGVKTGKK